MDEYSQEWDEVLAGGSGLHVRVPAGDIRIVAVDEEEVHLHAVKCVQAATEAEARGFLEQMRIERRCDGDDWFIEATWPQPRPHGIQSAHVSFEIRAPRAIRLEARSGHGRIEATGVGEARLSTGSGDVLAQALSGVLSAHTGHGAIQITECLAAVKAETGSGDIRISQAQDSVEATTGHGAVQIEGAAGPAKVESRSGDIRVRDIAAALEARTGHGRIEVVNAGEARLHTSSGDIRGSEISGRVEARTGHGAVQIDECSGAVQVESSSGDVRIRLVPSRVSATTGHGRIEAEEVGEAALRTRSGDIRARTVIGSLEAHTGHGAIEIDGCEGSIQAESSSGGIRIRQASGPVQVRTGHGAITAELIPADPAVQVEMTGTGGIDLSVPETVSARVEAETGSGRVEMQPETNARFNPRRTQMEAVLGDGRGQVRLRLSNGPIRIRLVGAP